MTRTGDWKKCQDILKTFDQRLNRNCTSALMKAALQLERLIKDRIINSRQLQSLHGFTIAQKCSSKPLIDHGDLLGSVGYRFVLNDAVFVGVNRKTPSGVNLAALHEREHGTKITVTPTMRAYLHARGLHLKATTNVLFIPGRSTIKPAYRDFKADGIGKKLFAEAIENTWRGHG